MSTGQDIIKLAKTRLGQRYLLGARVPMNNARHAGPWDCAEFVTWVVYQLTGELYGCDSNAGNPASVETYTGFWHRDVNDGRVRSVSVDEASRTVGAILLRSPRPGKIGHIAFVNSQRTTVEAHSASRGVTSDKVDGRRWDFGILIPNVSYVAGAHPPAAPSSLPTIYRLTDPLTKGPKVRQIQQALRKAGFDPGAIDGVFGSLTEAAARNFQAMNGLTPDGEVGPKTAAILGVPL